MEYKTLRGWLCYEVPPTTNNIFINTRARKTLRVVMMENPTESQIALLRHWSSYGQRGTTPNHRVAPHEWRNQPFSKPITTPWHVDIRPDQLPLLMLGFLPRKNSSKIYASQFLVPGDIMTTHIFMSTSQNPNMSASEDKWFIYSDGPDPQTGHVRLHMHRSWSGNKQIELLIDTGLDGYGKDGGGASIQAITWEADEEKRWKDASAETYMEVAREVCSWVLNVQLGASDESRELPTMEALTAAMKNLPSVKGSVYSRNY
ncbi:hypothetical protein B0T21DRAFT_407497 [Apiosordaria backusii]|uniref:Uncharacterized protein n=1 Tax=Apiosordaria backusii TaxID=314023 RepID=A0AA40K3B4_9PEZI|nr:hypothetical protein B0T21DRAFT_407497 [Apiosordaria backusii]